MGFRFQQSAIIGDGATPRTIVLSQVKKGGLIVVNAQWEGGNNGAITVRDTLGTAYQVGVQAPSIDKANAALAMQTAWGIARGQGSDSIRIDFPSGAGSACRGAALLFSPTPYDSVFGSGLSGCFGEVFASGHADRVIRLDGLGGCDADDLLLIVGFMNTSLLGNPTLFLINGIALPVAQRINITTGQGIAYLIVPGPSGAWASVGWNADGDIMGLLTVLGQAHRPFLAPYSGVAVN